MFRSGLAVEKVTCWKPPHKRDIVLRYPQIYPEIFCKHLDLSLAFAKLNTE